MQRNPKCELCALKDSLTVRCLPGGGNPITSSVVFVGDYPILEDFNKGQPFSGTVGTFLRNTIIKLGGDPQDYFYTNTLGCKPLEDRKPSKNELNACRAYYIQEILDIKPKLVVALGAVALESLTAQTGITKVRGNLKWSEELKCYVYPTYHPSAIMRSIELLGVFEEDISKIIAYSREAEIKQDKNSYQHIVIDTIDKFRKFLELALSAPRLATDIESTGFKYLEDRILCISFSHEPNKAMVVPLLGRYCRKIWTDEEYKEVVAGLKQVFENVKIILQNGKYDIKFFINELGVDRRKILDNFEFDTMLGHTLVEEEERHGLKELAWKYTSFGGYEEELEKYKNELKSYINKKLPLVCIDTLALHGDFKDKIESLKHHSLKYKAENQGIIQIDSTSNFVSVDPKTLILSQNTPIKKESQIAQIREFIHKENIERLFLFPNEDLTEFTQGVLFEALKPSRSKKDMMDEEGNAIDDFCYDIFPEDLLWRYNAIDSDVTIQVYYKLIPLLEAEGVRGFFDELVMGQNKVLIIMEMNGIYIDTNILEANRGRLLVEKDRLYDLILADPAVKMATELISNEKQKEIEKNFDKLTYPDWGEDKNEVALLQKAEQTPDVINQLNYYKLKAKERYIKHNMSKLDFRFNINSSNQLAILFLDVLKCQPISYTQKGSPQFNIENLDLYSAQFPVADLIGKYKSLNKFISMFVDGIKKRLSIDGRLRTDYQQTTVTGRLKSIDPNLQNLPKRKHGYVDPKDIRDFFTAPEGYKLVHMDLAQGEFKLWCEYAQDTDLMRDIELGLDIHRKIAAFIFKKKEEEVDKLERNKAKFAVFGLIYGRGAKSIAEEFDLTLAQAQGVADYFFSLYPNCRKWIDNQKRLAVQQGYVKNYFGRIRHLPILRMLQNKNIKDFDQITAGKLAEAQRQCVNAPIQSAVADFIGYSLIRLQKIIEENNYPVKIMLQIHDAIICEVKDEFVDTWKPLMKAEMVRKPEGFKTKIDSETEIGTSYGNLTAVKD